MTLVFKVLAVVSLATGLWLGWSAVELFGGYASRVIAAGPFGALAPDAHFLLQQAVVKSIGFLVFTFSLPSLCLSRMSSARGPRVSATPEGMLR